MPQDKVNTLRLTLSGKGIHPSSLSARELGELITSYENALLHLINRDFKSIDSKKVFISLVDIKDGSADLAFLPNFEEVYVAADRMNQSIVGNEFQSLPYGTVESLHKIWSFTKLNNCIATLNGQPGLTKAQISPEVEISVDESFYLEGETVIYGKLVRVGGATPKIRVQLEDNQIFSIEVKESQAKKLANRLYEVIGLKGIAKWRKETFSIESFKFIDFLPFEDQPFTQSVKELGEIIGSSWKDIDNPLDYILNQRYSS